jgi:hypothetical protein
MIINDNLRERRHRGFVKKGKGWSMFLQGLTILAMGLLQVHTEARD